MRMGGSIRVAGGDSNQMTAVKEICPCGNNSTKSFVVGKSTRSSVITAVVLELPILLLVLITQLRHHHTCHGHNF